MSSYLKEWCKETYLDACQMAEDLAPLLGGKVVRRDENDDCHSPASRSGTIELPSGLHIHIGTSWRNRAKAWVIRGGIDWRKSSKLNGHYRHTSFPDANIGAGKTLQKIAADISRRIVEPSAEPLAKALADYADLQARETGIASQVAALSARFPWLRVSLEQGKTEASLYSNGSGVYFSGRLTDKGAIYIDRVGTLEGSRAEAFLAMLAPENKS